MSNLVTSDKMLWAFTVFTGYVSDITATDVSRYHIAWHHHDHVVNTGITLPLSNVRCHIWLPATKCCEFSQYSQGMSQTSRQQMYHGINCWCITMLCDSEWCWTVLQFIVPVVNTTVVLHQLFVSSARWFYLHSTYHHHQYDAKVWTTACDGGQLSQGMVLVSHYTLYITALFLFTTLITCH